MGTAQRCTHSFKILADPSRTYWETHFTGGTARLHLLSVFTCVKPPLEWCATVEEYPSRLTVHGDKDYTEGTERRKHRASRLAGDCRLACITIWSVLDIKPKIDTICSVHQFGLHFLAFFPVEKKRQPKEKEGKEFRRYFSHHRKRENS